MKNVVVVGASAGGVRALQALVGGFPEDFPAAVLIVMHTSPDFPSLLPDILARAGKLVVAHVPDGATIKEGCIYVAPPNQHLILEGEKIRVQFGPRVNRFRPAIDPLFRSAAEFYGSRAIGVILSGTLSDGCVGLAAIKQAGGVAIVQDPVDADFPYLPENALRNVEPDYMESAARIPGLLTEILGQLPLKKEKAYMANDGAVFTGITCPDCDGPILKSDEGGLVAFRCIVGHAYSAEAMLEEHSRGIENALWGSIAKLKGHATILHMIASNCKEDVEAAEYEEQARQHEERASELLRMLEKMNTPQSRMEAA